MILCRTISSVLKLPEVECGHLCVHFCLCYWVKQGSVCTFKSINCTSDEIFLTSDTQIHFQIAIRSEQKGGGWGGGGGEWGVSKISSKSLQ